jgi:pimeloyl-ACP methyl ester carboxylesterase
MRPLFPRSMARVSTYAILVLVLGGVGCYRYQVGESFWFHQRPGPAADSVRMAGGLPAGYALTRVVVPASGGTQLVGIAATSRAARETILYFGGDDFVVRSKGPAVLRALVEAAPVNVVLIDYAGSGESGGTATLARLKADALTVFDWVAINAAPSSGRVIVHGHSIGSFIAASVAAVRPVGGLVLQGAATTPADWLHDFFRPSRLKWWARVAYPFVRFSLDSTLAAEDNVARVRQYRGPLLILSGSDDDTTSPAMSRALLVASASPDSLKRLVILEGSGHGDVFDNPAFAAAYRQFLQAIQAHAPAP